VKSSSGEPMVRPPDILAVGATNAVDTSTALKEIARKHLHAKAAVGVLLMLLTTMLTGMPQAQTIGNPQSASSTDTVTLHTGTQLVILDVIVRGRNGEIVHGLKREDFIVEEDNAIQTIKRIEEHTSATPLVSVPTIPHLPEGTFTDYNPVPPSGALTVLLLDALNTAMSDQSYVHEQLHDYIRHAQPGTRIAILGLSNHLYMLQGFTSNLGTLKIVIDHKLTQDTSNLLADAAGSNADPTTISEALSDGAPPTPPQETSSVSQIAANLQQFELGEASAQTQLRVQYTLDAFVQLGHYLANFPGRKNLIWFSGSFPLNIFPDATVQGGSEFTQNNQDQFHEAIDLLAQGQVSVYPVDARGLLSNPMYSAARSGRGYGKNPASVSADLAKFNQSQAIEHSTMEQLAEATGGHAYYNTNGLAAAVASAIDSGSNYYTLTYTPTNRNWAGEFRRFHISLRGPLADGVTLSYRRGYYADNPDQPTNTAPGAKTVSASAMTRAASYSQAAMARGAPAPEDILFKARVLPATVTNEETLAPGNQLDRGGRLKSPFRRFAIDVAVPPSQFHLALQTDGRRTGKIDLTTFVYDSEGNVLNRVGRVIDLNLTPDTYARFMAGAVDMHLDVSAPVKGEAYFRIGVHDVSANHLGVVEVPMSAVIQLPPISKSAP